MLQNVYGNISRRLGFLNLIIIEAKGRAGGLALLWNDDLIVEKCWNTERVICCKVKECGRENCWNLIASYGTLYLNAKAVFGIFLKKW